MFTNAHKKLLARGVKLGALPDAMGLCVGLSAKWIESVLMHDKSTFEKQIQRILDDSELPKKIRRVKNKVRNGEKITAKEHELFDVLAFYDGLQLYYASQNVHGIKDQLDLSSFSQFEASKKTADKGFLKEIYSEPGIYTQKEIEGYLNALARTIDKVGCTDEVGFMLSNKGHAIALSYHPSTHNWCVMDINQWKIKKSVYGQFKSFTKQLLGISKGAHHSREVAAKIKLGFSSHLDEKKNEYSAFSAKAIVLGNSKYADALTKAFLQLKKTHEITYDMSQRSEEVNLLYIATKFGHADYVEKLLTFPAVNLSIDNPSEKFPPSIIVAILQEYPGILEQLIEYYPKGQARHDYVNAKILGETPLTLAAIEGNSEIVKVLLAHGANPKIPYAITVEALRDFATREECLEKAELFISKKSKESGYDPSNISLFPKDDAWIRGHDEIVQLLAAAEQKVLSTMASSKNFTNKYKEEMRPTKENPVINKTPKSP
ncbi:MAG: ankyrin repeat domain-containing protein [Legionella sp.]|nr:ankyrin repeat domain-containing protein [Legionella sp.]